MGDIPRRARTTDVTSSSFARRLFEIGAGRRAIGMRPNFVAFPSGDREIAFMAFGGDRRVIALVLGRQDVGVATHRGRTVYFASNVVPATRLARCLVECVLDDGRAATRAAVVEQLRAVRGRGDTCACACACARGFAERIPSLPPRLVGRECIKALFALWCD